MKIPETMQAVQLDKDGGPLTVRQIPVPKPEAGEVLVRIAASPINPSDLGFIEGGHGYEKTFPVVPGVEGSGTVVAAQSVASGNSITVYAITRDTYGNFVSNAAGTWSLTGKTAGVVDGDLEIAFSFSCKHKKS